MPFLRKYNTLLVTGTTAIRIPIIKRGVVDFAVSADWTPAAGDVKIAVDGAAPTNVTNLPTAVASGNGAYWEFILTGAELSCKQAIVTIVDAATKAIEDQSFIVETFGNASALYQADFSAANLPANVTQLLGTAWATPATAGLPDVNAKQLGGTNQSGRDIAASVLVGGYTSGQDSVLRRGTAQAGGASTATLDSGASATDGLYVGASIAILAGTGAGQDRVITNYVGATKVATVSRAWTTNPDNTSVFILLPAEVDVETWLRSAPAALDANAFVKVDVEDWKGSTAVAMTGDAYARLGAPAGASVSADVAAVKAVLPTALDANGFIKADVEDWKGATAPAMTGDAYARLGAPAGASVSADIATVNAGVSVKSGGIVRASFADDTGLRSIRSGTAQAGGATSITLDAGASAVTDFYKNALIAIMSGTGAGQARFCTAYNGSTKVATVGAWATNPDNTSVFAITGFDAIPGATAPTAAAVATAVWTDLLAGSDFSTVSSVGKLLKDDIDAAISSRSTYAGADTAGTTTLLSRIASALTITGGKVDVNDKTGFSLSSAGVQAIWDALTSALSTVSSIGKLLVDNVNATVSSRLASAGYAAPLDASGTRAAVGLSSANLDAQLAAIAAKTANLPEGLKKNTALNNFEFFMADAADHVTGKTGLTVTATRSIDGGAFSACTNTPSEVGSGYYKINLSAADLNGDVVTLRFAATGSDGAGITVKTSA